MKIILFDKKTSTDFCSSLGFRKNIKSFGFFLAIFLIGIYVFQTSEMAKETHLAKQQNIETKRILQESRGSDYGFLQQKSLPRVQAIAADLGFERVSDISYIQVADVQVAAK